MRGEIANYMTYHSSYRKKYLRVDWVIRKKVALIDLSRRGHHQLGLSVLVNMKRVIMKFTLQMTVQKNTLVGGGVRGRL